MKVVDPGHVFELDVLVDGGDRIAKSWPRKLIFIKRQGPKYPGNVGAHPGTTTQEVLRALIARTVYVDGQEPSIVNLHVLESLRRSLYLLEERAAFRAGRAVPEAFSASTTPESFPTCARCGHVGCNEACEVKPKGPYR